MSALRERLAACPDPPERERLTHALRDLTLKYGLMVERYRTTRRPE
jgi:hypothetical protein